MVNMTQLSFKHVTWHRELSVITILTEVGWVPKAADNILMHGKGHCLGIGVIWYQQNKGKVQ